MHIIDWSFIIISIVRLKKLCKGKYLNRVCHTQECPHHVRNILSTNYMVFYTKEGDDAIFSAKSDILVIEPRCISVNRNTIYGVTVPRLVTLTYILIAHCLWVLYVGAYISILSNSAKVKQLAPHNQTLKTNVVWIARGSPRPIWHT